MKIASVKRGELLHFIDSDNIAFEAGVNPNRVFKLNGHCVRKKPVVYLMSRECRTVDNWGLIYAQELALENEQPLLVCAFYDKNIKINSRKLYFAQAGLEVVSEELKALNIPFVSIVDEPENLLSFLKGGDFGAVISDFSPLLECIRLSSFLSENLDIAYYEVDSHNIVPARFISSKQEYSAATFRAKVKANLEEFLTEIPKLKTHPFSFGQKIEIRSDNLGELEEKGVEPLSWIKPAQKEALIELENFVDFRLHEYSKNRNNPTQNVLSNMSIYLHYGHISAQRIAIEVIKSSASTENKEEYLEELIVRKELSDNFCLYNNNYKNINCFPKWARLTLEEHKNDIRSYEYSLEDFEAAKTHDSLWNAAQIELKNVGKIHSYMRMYWCKKILEWSRDYQSAQEIAIFLNDKYALDGIEPNGYVGINWCIGGVHDRAWGQRNIFGKIRYMSESGCKKKFDTQLYIKMFENVF